MSVARVGEPCPCCGAEIEDPRTALITCYDGVDRQKTVCRMCGGPDGY
jgi:hypothetical protein